MNNDNDERPTPADQDATPTAPHGDYAPWRQTFPDGCGHEVEIDPLRLRLDIHDELILRHVYGPGELVATTAISGTAFRQAVAADAHFATGILPSNALWCGITPAGQRTMIFVSSRIWRVKLRERFAGPVAEFALPMPDLVFMCLRGGQAPYVWAVRGRPTREDAVFYRCPAFNIFETGRICMGSHPFPDDPAQIPAAFFDSYFSPDGQHHHRSVGHPGDLRALWDDLDGRKTYPVDDLVAQFTFADATHAGTHAVGW